MTVEDQSLILEIHVLYLDILFKTPRNEPHILVSRKRMIMTEYEDFGDNVHNPL